jgi:23S rRNA G2069 N7-methylase RlmK/C1962 C5-methylase RlmI
MGERFGREILVPTKTSPRATGSSRVPSLAESVGFDLRIFAVPAKEERRARKAAPVFRRPGGESASIATEHNLKFLIDFDAGYSVGFFIDQRENRRYVPGGAKRLLNCSLIPARFPWPELQ